MTRIFIYAAVLIGLTNIFALGQNTVPETVATPAPLEVILSEAEKQTRNYQQEFKNLLADETKTFERFDKSGEVKDKNVVESTFLVYQSARNEKISSELRNVVKVDGKPVPDSQQRSEQLLAELQKQTTFEKELERLQRESARYDKTLEIYGVTLSEAVILSENLRPFFDFKLLGTENYNGNQVYVVSYQQTRTSPFVTLNSKERNPGVPSLNFNLDVPGKLKNEGALLRGKLWIDAQTYQIWREERELTVQPQNPIVLLQNTLEYQTSDYGILVPKQISLVSNNVRKNDNDQYAAVSDMRVNFDYSRFRKTEVDIKIIDEP